jgi:ERCC4-related helicase
MAPTKPLVHQQIESCYKVMGIPMDDTAEVTGNHQCVTLEVLMAVKMNTVASLLSTAWFTS